MNDLTKRATYMGRTECRGALVADADAPAGVIGADWTPAVTLRASEDQSSWSFRGEASVVEHPYTVYDAFGEFTETIAEGAFTKTLSEDPLVSFVSMHEQGTVMAQTRGRGLVLRADPNLSVEATLPKNDADVARIAPKIERGLMNAMSCAFRVTRQEWDEDYMNRRILEVNLQGGDVSVITTGHGANPAAHGDLRISSLLSYLDEHGLDDEQRAALASFLAGEVVEPPASFPVFDLRDLEDRQLLDTLAVASL